MKKQLKTILIIVSIIAILGSLYYKVSLSESNKIDLHSKTLVLAPIFTESAYSKNGFYSYYNKECGKECLTVKINNTDPSQMSSSRNAYKIFKEKQFHIINDLQLDNNPNVLKNYSLLIVLHNEYVTEKEFKIITSFPNVIYLYPNALYAKVKNNNNESITLLRGHGYPEGITNGFNWRDDNTKYEFDRDCNNMFFYKVSNGYQLNCYPEYSMIAQIIWNRINSSENGANHS
jgi:hypothetical protein